MDHSLESLANTANTTIITETFAYLQFTFHHLKTMLLSLSHQGARVMAVDPVSWDIDSGRFAGSCRSLEQDRPISEMHRLASVGLFNMESDL